MGVFPTRPVREDRVGHGGVAELVDARKYNDYVSAVSLKREKL